MYCLHTKVQITNRAYFHLLFCMDVGVRGGANIEALRHNPEGHEFDSQ